VVLWVSWKESALLNTEVPLTLDIKDDVDVMLSDFLFTPCLFGDLGRSRFVVFVPPTKPAIECVGCRAFLNPSSILPSCAGLLEGNSCFASSLFLGGGGTSLASALPNIASAIEEYGLLETWFWRMKVVEDRGGGLGIRAFQLTLPASSPRVASERAGKRTKLAGIHLKLNAGKGFIYLPIRIDFSHACTCGETKAQNRESRPNR